MEKGERGRESDSRGEVASWKWLHSSFCEFHTILVFHPFSNRCILSKMVGKRDWTAVFKGIVLTGYFIYIYYIHIYIKNKGVCVRQNLHINQSCGWPTSLHLFMVLWKDLNNTQMEMWLLYLKWNAIMAECIVYTRTLQDPLSVLSPCNSHSLLGRHCQICGCSVKKALKYLTSCSRPCCKCRSRKLK